VLRPAGATDGDSGVVVAALARRRRAGGIEYLLSEAMRRKAVTY
jgi:hypothetical protein